MLEKIAGLARETIPGVDAATITTIDRGRPPKTAAATDDSVRALDELQYRLGDGPCITAIREQSAQHLVVTVDARWPEFSRAAAKMGITEVMSAPLIDREAVKGSLNLYTQSSYGDEVEGVVSSFAVQLGIAVANAALYVERVLVAEQLEQALASRAVIEQAKGILMGAQRCDSDTAFRMLVRASQTQNRKLRDIAAEIVSRYSGTSPSQ
jgi:GAF domain-containing protein